VAERKFLVHFVFNRENSQAHLEALCKEGFNLIGIEVPEQVALSLPLHFNIGHRNGFPACINAFEFKNLVKKNCLVLVKPDLDTLMSIAILRKIAYREQFTEKELIKIDLVARHDLGHALEGEERDIIARLIAAIQQEKFFSRWQVLYKWMTDDLELGDYDPLNKASRQILIEKVGDVIILISLGIGALGRRHLKSCPYVLLLNPYFPFPRRRGRRYCIYSRVELNGVPEALNQIDPGWGGHEKIVCSNVLEPSKIEIEDILRVLQQQIPREERSNNELGQNSTKIM
jgi:hypothetical protein